MKYKILVGYDNPEDCFETIRDLSEFLFNKVVFLEDLQSCRCLMVEPDGCECDDDYDYERERDFFEDLIYFADDLITKNITEYWFGNIKVGVEK